MNKVYSTLDCYLASIIYLYTGILPELINHRGKVSFNFPFDGKVFEAIKEYDSGMEVTANRFVHTVKHFKAQIFQMKESNMGGGDTDCR